MLYECTFQEKMTRRSNGLEGEKEANGTVNRYIAWSLSNLQSMRGVTLSKNGRGGRLDRCDQNRVRRQPYREVAREN